MFSYFVHVFAKTYLRPCTGRTFLNAESSPLYSGMIVQQKYLRAGSTKCTFSGVCAVLIFYPKLHQMQQGSFFSCLLDKFSLFCFISDPENEGLKQKASSSAALLPRIPPSFFALQLRSLPPASHPSLQVPAAPTLPARNIKPSSETMWVNISCKVFIYPPFSACHFPPPAAAQGCRSYRFLREGCLTLLSLSHPVPDLFRISFY